MDTRRDDGSTSEAVTTAAAPRKSSACCSYCSFSCVVITIFAIYIGLLAQTLVTILLPGGLFGFDLKPSEQYGGRPPPTWDPLWQQGQQIQAVVYLSSKRRPASGRRLSKVASRTPLIATTGRKKSSTSDSTEILLWKASNLSYGWDGTFDEVREFNLTREVLPRSLWSRAISGKSMYVHAHISHRDVDISSSRSGLRHVTATSSMIKPVRPQIEMPTYRLVPFGMCGDRTLPIDPPDPTKVRALRQAMINTAPHWKPETAFRVVVDDTRYPKDQVPALIGQWLHIDRGSSSYAPPAFADDVGVTSKKYVALNASTQVLPLRIKLSPSSLGRWQLGMLMEQSLQTMQASFGAQAKDSDDIRTLLTETHPLVLVMTMVVSLLHVLFDLLAFRSDIEFWRKLKSTAGLSGSQMRASLVCQTVVLAYLHHKDASKLVLIPAGFGVLLQVWKVWKVSGSSAEVVPGNNGAPLRPASDRTAYYDAVASTYLGQTLYPIVLGSTLFSLLCSGYEGTYDWFITSAVRAVYTFGFIAMTPQLVIKYKLKSVAHLPWRFMVYRALNTFIDDIFAFIITMPTMHRLSCFRDDIVFFIYLYQRHLYPVDTSRPSIGAAPADSSAES